MSTTVKEAPVIDEAASRAARREIARAAQVSMSDRKSVASDGAFALSDIFVADVVALPDPFFKRRTRR